MPAPEDCIVQHRRETEKKARDKMKKAMHDVHSLLAEYNLDKKGRADAIGSLVWLFRSVPCCMLFLRRVH